MRIRDAVPDDAAFLAELVPSFAAFGLPPWRRVDEFLAVVEQSLSHAIGSSGTVLIAEDDDGTPLGFAHLHPVTDLTGRRRGHVSDLAVSEGARGHGVGRALIGAAEQWARAEGYELLGLTAIATNEPALGFYEKLGFGQDTITLVKPVEPR